MGRILKYAIGFKVSDRVAQRIITELVLHANGFVGGPYITSINNFQRSPDSTTFDMIMPTIGNDNDSNYINIMNNIVTPFLEGTIYSYDIIALP